jgi:hypothetical protein
MSALKKVYAIAGMLLISLTCPENSMAVDFAPPAAYPVGTNPSSVVVADFNGDGKPDIAVANRGSGNVSILLGSGNGTFQAAVNFVAGGGPQRIAVGDFNGDGKLDLAVLLAGDATNGPGFSVLLGNGDGTFQASRFVPNDNIAAAMAVTDFNLDKKSDVAISFINSNQQIVSLLIFLSNGDGTFQPPKNVTLPFGGSGSLATADFNKDGKPDLVVDSLDGYNVLLGQGDGTFQPPSAVRVADTFSGAGVQIADLNQDGVPDLIANSSAFVSSCCEGPSSLSTHLSIFLGNGDGTFQAEQILATSMISKANVFAPPAGDAISPAGVGDFDGDGILDLLFSRTTYSGFTHSTTGNVMLGKGNGTYSESSPVNLSFSASAVADLNGDSLYDFLSFQGDSVAVSLNTSPIVHALTVTFAGDGSGSISSSPAGVNCSSSVGTCSIGQISPGAVYTLAAAPTGNSLFAGWSGACTGTDPNACSVTMSANESVTAKFSLPPDFTLSPAAQNLVVKNGGQASEILMIGTQGGFSGAIQLSCNVTGRAPRPTCSLSPANIPPGANSPTSMLTVNTSGLSAAMIPQSFERAGALYATWLPLGLMGCMLTAGFDKKRRRLWLFLLVMVATVLPAACGGSSSGPPPPQSYTVAVAATSGALQHSTNISVTVN